MGAALAAYRRLSSFVLISFVSMTIVTPYFPSADFIEHDGVEYHYAWGSGYRRSPTDWTDDDWNAACSDHASFGYSFDGYEYSSYYYDDSDSPNSCWVIQCPGPDAPPLQGPPERDCGSYWVTQATAFVYDEAVELALREQRRAQLREERELHERLHTPGYAWCEFA